MIFANGLFLGCLIGESVRSVAMVLDVSVSSVVKWSQRYRSIREYGSRSAGGRPRPSLAPHRAWLVERIGSGKHVTLRGLQAELASPVIVISFNLTSSSGPVGPAMQKRVAELLGMHEMALPSRTNRTHMCEYVQLLALTASTFHKIADEVAQCSSAEYGELFEVFSDGVVGSSTMPQKVNPKLSMGIMANCQKLYALSSMILRPPIAPLKAMPTPM